MGNVAKHVIYKGRVQGVGFRFTAQRIALRYELAGFVKNLPDGTVEMFAQGNSDDIANALRDIEETFGGYLKDTIITDNPLDNRLHSFDITF